MNNWAVDQLNAAETEAEQARVAEAIESLSERFASGEIRGDQCGGLAYGAACALGRYKRAAARLSSAAAAQAF